MNTDIGTRQVPAAIGDTVDNLASAAEMVDTLSECVEGILDDLRECVRAHDPSLAGMRDWNDVSRLFTLMQQQTAIVKAASLTFAKATFVQGVAI